MNPKHKKQIPLRPPPNAWSSYFKVGRINQDKATQRNKTIADTQKNLLQGKPICDLTCEDLKRIAEKLDNCAPEEKAAAIQILKLKWQFVLSDYAKETSFQWANNLSISAPSSDDVIRANKKEKAQIDKLERNFWNQILSDTTKQKISEHAKRDLTSMNDGDFVAWVDFVLRPEIL